MSKTDDGAHDPHVLGHGECLLERPLAIKVAIDGDQEPKWVPKSVLHDDSEVFSKGDTGKIVVEAWWGEKSSPRDREKRILPLKKTSSSRWDAELRRQREARIRSAGGKGSHS